jgi:phosphohistidine swiveling domain-containing protein
MARYIKLLRAGPRRKRVGGKTAGLESLVRMGLRVPQTYLCSARALKRYTRCRDRDRLLLGLREELRALGISTSCEYAIRSSAALEDGSHVSMAGQYESLLRVRGVDHVLNSIQAVWNSTPGVLNGREADSGFEEMEVLIQEMVPAVVSGASFSRHPVTGADEVIVEAVEGTSEAFLQRGATPKQWAVRDGMVESDWPLIPTDALKEITLTTARVADELRYPADLEWAFDGQRIWWLQVRPITSLRGLPVYSNRISREYLPGLVKPLVWSINVPMINGAWVDLFERVVGPLPIDPLSLAKRFHYRAYFNMSGMGKLLRRLGLPEDSLEQVLGLIASPGRSPFGFRWKMLRHLPRLLRFLLSLGRLHVGIPTWERKLTACLARDERALSHARALPEMMDWVEGFLVVMRGVAQRRILSLLLHLVSGQLGRMALSHRGIADPSELELPDTRLEVLDPNSGVRNLASALQAMPVDTLRKVGELSPEEFLQLEEAQEFKIRFDDFMVRFGHIGESGNDFSAKPWREDPASVLHMAIAQVAAESAGRRDPLSASPDRRTTRWARRVTKRRLDRERVGAIFSRGFYLLHLWALGVGRILETRDVVETPYDVFFLGLDELRSLASGEIGGPEASSLVRERRAEMAQAESISLPDMILGDRVADVDSKSNTESELRGIAVSRGIYEGPVCVVRSIAEFPRFSDGAVLVVPFSDVAWTPLFVRAGAIVAEAGGILSHSSIVAREAGIPAVVSVPNACERLDGERVRVDGLEGRVTILESS